MLGSAFYKYLRSSLTFNCFTAYNNLYAKEHLPNQYRLFWACTGFDGGLEVLEAIRSGTLR